MSSTGRLHTVLLLWADIQVVRGYTAPRVGKGLVRTEYIRLSMEVVAVALNLRYRPCAANGSAGDRI